MYVWIWIKHQAWTRWPQLERRKRQAAKTKLLGLQTPSRSKSVKFCAFPPKPDAFRAPAWKVVRSVLLPNPCSSIHQTIPAVPTLGGSFACLRWAWGCWDGEREPGRNCARTGRKRNVLLRLPWSLMLAAGRRCYLAVATSWTERKFKQRHPKGCVQIHHGSSLCCVRLVTADVRAQGLLSLKDPVAMAMEPLAKYFWFLSFSCN